MIFRLLAVPALVLGVAVADAQYALQVQGGRAFHGTGDYRGFDLRAAASRTLVYGVDLRLTYQNAAYAAGGAGADLQPRGVDQRTSPLHIGDNNGADLGAFDEYVQTWGLHLGLARDTRLSKSVYLYTAAAGGLHAERRKDLTSAQYQSDGRAIRLTAVRYGLSSFRTAVLALDFGLAYKHRGLTVGPYVSAQTGGRGVGTTGVGLLLRVDWPAGGDES